MRLVTPDEMRKIDTWAIKEMGVPGVVLMENAGKGTIDEIEKEYGSLVSKKVIVVCGKGNNGGDGFVIARYLKKRGVEVSVFLIGDRKDVKGDARTNLDIILKMGVEVNEILSVDSSKSFSKTLSGFDIIVDAIFGTGFKGKVSGITVDIIRTINESKKVVVSVDIPSGMDSEDGTVEGVCVKADLTCTMCLPKRGLYFYPGRNYRGVLRVIDIGTPQPSFDDKIANLIDLPLAKSILPVRPPEGHKGTFGRILILAGSPGMTGAATLSSLSALRSGAGLVYLGIPKSLNPILEEKATEVVTVPLPETDSQTVASSALEVLDKYLQMVDVLALGPGVGVNKDTRDLIIRLIENFDKPIIVDADGINNLSIDDIRGKNSNLLLTPHPGELSRLVGMSPEEINRRRLDIAVELSGNWNIVLALKGAPTIVASPDGRCFVNSSGCSALATAGSGDVLTGIIAGFCAQGVDILLSTVLGIYVHGLSGDLAAREKTEYSVIAGDVMEKIPDAIKDVLYS